MNSNHIGKLWYVSAARSMVVRRSGKMVGHHPTALLSGDQMFTRSVAWGRSNPVKPKAVGRQPNGMQAAEMNLEGEPGTDLALVRDAKRGNTAALQLLIRRYTDKLFHIAFRVTNCHDAEEVVQDAFIKAFNEIHSFEERSRFSTWLTQIAINTALIKVVRTASFRAYSKKRKGFECEG